MHTIQFSPGREIPCGLRGLVPICRGLSDASQPLAKVEPHIASPARKARMMHTYVADHRAYFYLSLALRKRSHVGSLPRVDSHKVSGNGD